MNEIISEQSMTEIHIKVCQYTWRNMQNNPLLEIFDKVFSSVEWTTIFPNTFKSLAKPLSDYVTLCG